MLSCVGVLITHNDQLTTNFNCFFKPLVSYVIVFLFFLKQLSSLGSPSLHRSRRWVLSLPSPSLQPTQGFVGSLSSAGKPLGCFFHVDGSAELKVKATEGLRGWESGGYAIWLGWQVWFGTVKIKRLKLRKMCTDSDFLFFCTWDDWWRFYFWVVGCPFLKQRYLKT